MNARPGFSMLSSLSLSLSLFTLLATGCSTSLTCKTEPCNTNSKSYDVCAGITGATYNFGGMSCSCTVTSGACTACTASVTAFCGGGATMVGDMANGAGGSGGSGGGGSTDMAASSCSVVGTFTNTTPSGGMATLTQSGSDSSGTSMLTIVTASGTIMISSIYTVSGNQITITNTSSSPSSVQGCLGESAVYTMTYDGGCKHLTLNKVSDQCAGRVADANGATLTRQ